MNQMTPFDRIASAADPVTIPKAKPRRRKWFVFGFLAVLLGVISVYFGAYRQVFSEEQPQLRTDTVKRGTLERTVTAVGTLDPRNYVDVGTQVSGQLKTLHVEIGDHVDAGTLIAEIDPILYQSIVDSDQAKLKEMIAQRAQAESELNLAKVQFGRKEKLAAKKFMSQDELDVARSSMDVSAAKLEVMDAQIDQARADLKTAEANLAYTRIYSSLSGTVVSQSAVQGQTLNANQTAPIIVRVADLKTMTAKAQVVEADVVRIKPGMQAYFSTLGLPDRRWHGTVRKIQPTPETINDVVLYDVLVDVPNDDGVLLPGMSVQISFIEDVARDVSIVPLAAVTTQDDGAQEVRVLSDDKVKNHKVDIGLTNRTEAEVKSGLAVGDTVVTGTVVADKASTQQSGPPFGVGGLFGRRGNR